MKMPRVFLLLLLLFWAKGAPAHESTPGAVEDWDFASATGINSDQEHGFVNVTWQDGKAYAGDLINGLPNGHGLLIIPPRDKYE